MATNLLHYSDDETLFSVASKLHAQGKKISCRFSGFQQPQADMAQERLDSVKEKMGDKLICNPGYVTTPRHSVHKHVYEPARNAYLLKIRHAAALDRRKNPMACDGSGQVSF